MSAAARAERISQEAADHFNDPAKDGKLFIPSAPDAITRENTVSFLYDSLDEAFPKVEPGERPVGNVVLVQLRQVKQVTRGGIILETETRRTEVDNNQVAKVIALGPLAFKNRNSGDEWPEGAWAHVGDFVRVPKYAGDRFIQKYTRPDYRIDEKTGKRVTTQVRDEVQFLYIKDMSIIAVIADPLTVRAFL